MSVTITDDPGLLALDALFDQLDAAVAAADDVAVALILEAIFKITEEGVK